MKSLPRNRILLISAVLLPLVLLVALLYVRSRPATIGDFTLPILSGWKQNVFKTERNQKIVYTKLAKDHTSSISLTWQSYRASNPPRTIQDLQNEVKQINATLMRLKMPGKQSRSSAHPIPLNGLAAIQTENVSQYSSHGMTHGKSIYFVCGSNYYILNANVSGAAITPEAQAEMDRALGEITNVLTPVSS